jgi:hypothetical protein
MDAKIKLTGLWQNKTKSGETYYAGNLSPGVRLLVFRNNFKQGERDPDLVVYLAPSERKERDAPAPEPPERHPGLESEETPF